MRYPHRLAFVDVETTGLSPTENRIAEIGIVTVDGDCAERWTTFVRTSSIRESGTSAGSGLRGPGNAPSFADIAGEIAQKLSGRVLIAHNARFDHAFLRAEFDRVGIAFLPEVVCSVMLSRRLYPHLEHHDLDSLVQHHGLSAPQRHRALPDADLVWQLWQVIHAQHSSEVIGSAVDALLAGPVLPDHLDASMTGRLPETPGAYVFHDQDGKPLLVGAAANLKLHIVNYFRIDRATDKALEYAHRIANITWRATRGMLGAQLHAMAIENDVFAGTSRKLNAPLFTWRLSVDAVPCVEVVPISYAPSGTDSFGLFPTERKARNALLRFAAKHRLCHCLLGVSGIAKGACLACPIDRGAPGCTDQYVRKKLLVRLFTALRPMRVPPWPHRGPVGIRERSDLHVIDQWQFLGTAHSDSDVHALLETRRDGFDHGTYRLLNRALPRLPKRKIVDLVKYASPPGATPVPTDHAE
jgi:DNA polymerase-3 subunit epsilon